SISQEKPLQAGTFIMLGSVVKTVHLEKPAEVTIRFDELGEVSVKFAGYVIDNCSSRMLNFSGTTEKHPEV
ncbi:MAG: hypothetical protein HVK29_04785, partial [Pelagibacteraceae bacterium]|nr:hypothetical protein [Pelagibacteraceae bacterium]